VRNEETDNENTENTVKFVKLNLNQIELFSLKDFPFIENGKAFLKDWLIELPALHFIDLIECNLEELGPTIFQNLIFLEKLYLSYNSIRELDANIFACNKNLKILNLGFI
jgi:Leucine-rich repeat (LRR) protein